MEAEVKQVTPCVGVWIETRNPRELFDQIKVTPCVGVWIETTLLRIYAVSVRRHTLRGCVD